MDLPGTARGNLTSGRPVGSIDSFNESIRAEIRNLTAEARDGRLEVDLFVAGSSLDDIDAAPEENGTRHQINDDDDRSFRS